MDEQDICTAVKPRTLNDLRRESIRSPVKSDLRKNAHRRGYNYRWRKARIAFLLENPLCVVCAAAGRTTQATVVDHIVPHKGNQDLFWDRGNWQGLCKQCSDRKTATRDGGFGRAVKTIN